MTDPGTQPTTFRAILESDASRGYKNAKAILDGWNTTKEQRSLSREQATCKKIREMGIEPADTHPDNLPGGRFYNMAHPEVPINEKQKIAPASQFQQKTKEQMIAELNIEHDAIDEEYDRTEFEQKYDL